mgnify:CR=1 FL=1
MILDRRSRMWRRIIVEAQLARARLSAGAVTALALVSGALSAAAISSPAHAQNCEAAVGMAVLPSPRAPWTGAPLRVIVATEKPIDGELSLVAPDGQDALMSRSGNAAGADFSGVTPARTAPPPRAREPRPQRSARRRCAP